MLKDNKKKVLHVSHSDIRSDSRILKELKALELESAYELLAVGIESKSVGRSLSVLNVDIQVLPLIFTRSKWKPSFIRHCLALVEFVLKVFVIGTKFRPSIIHCHDTLALAVGGLVSLVTGAKVVYDAHELESRKNSQSRLAGCVTYFIEKIFWPRVDLFISVSPSIIDWYKRKLGDKRAILVLNSPVFKDPVGSRLEGFDSPSTYLRNKFEIPKNHKIFIYVGLLTSGRGIERILDVFSDFNDEASVVFLGYGDLKESLKKVSIERSNIYLHDAVPHDEVVSVIRGADFGLALIENVSLSDFYCLPNKAFEYAFSKTPIIASNFPDLSRLVNDHDLGVVSDLSKRALVATIGQLLLNERSFFSTDLSDLGWEAQAGRLVSEYAAL